MNGREGALAVTNVLAAGAGMWAIKRLDSSAWHGPAAQRPLVPGPVPWVSNHRAIAPAIARAPA